MKIPLSKIALPGLAGVLSIGFFIAPAQAHVSPGTTSGALSPSITMIINPPEIPMRLEIKKGQSLWSLAERYYHDGAAWKTLYLANKRSISDPCTISTGLMINVPVTTGKESGISCEAPVHHSEAVTISQPAAPVASAPAAVNFSGFGAFQQCVIQAESGGNPTAVNPYSGAGGLYGFLPSTWQALGFPGLPENASVAMQNAAFAKEYAQSGTAPWAPYDGC